MSVLLIWEWSRGRGLVLPLLWQSSRRERGLGLVLQLSWCRLPRGRGVCLARLLL